MNGETGKDIALIAFGQLPEGASEDELDVLDELCHVEGALVELNFQTVRLAVTLDLQAMAEKIRAAAPSVVFNLVESLDGHDALQYLAPAVFDTLGVVYTGARTDAVYCTTNKHLAKQLLLRARIPTPAWQRCDEAFDNGIAFDPPYIVKRVSEDASRGIDDRSVMQTTAELVRFLDALRRRERCRTMVEQFVAGREFNVSLLSRRGSPGVLPVAEIVFADYPADKPAIVGYRAKWDKASFEYSHTPRRFATGTEDLALRQQLGQLSKRCWTALDLSGYARVDFRVDSAGRPWVLEVNANPCLSPDAGLAAAAQQAGMTYRELIAHVIASARGTTALPRVTPAPM